MRSEFASSSEDQISVTPFYLNEDEKGDNCKTSPKPEAVSLVKWKLWDKPQLGGNVSGSLSDGLAPFPKDT